jgi:predicted TIM-barrel fold metal-dependent hydrolase
MIKTPQELLIDLFGEILTDPITIPKNWIYQMCEQYADQYIEMGIGNPKKLQANVVEVKREMAKKLRDKGFSFRQIQKALGYKSVRSIPHLLKNSK